MDTRYKATLEVAEIEAVAVRRALAENGDGTVNYAAKCGVYSAHLRMATQRALDAERRCRELAEALRRTTQMLAEEGDDDWIRSPAPLTVGPFRSTCLGRRRNDDRA